MVSLHSIGAVNTQLHHKEPPSWVWHIHWSSVLCKYKDMGSECQMGRFLPAYLQLKHCLHWKRRAGRKAGCFTWLHSCCLLLGCHCWLESLTTTQVSSVLCHWAGLKISIKSHQDHLWVHAGHVIFKIQTYCGWLSHRDSIQISFFLSLILFKKKKEFTIPCITCCINPSHTRPKTAHRREQTKKWDERHQACCW